MWVFISVLKGTVTGECLCLRHFSFCEMPTFASQNWEKFTNEATSVSTLPYNMYVGVVFLPLPSHVRPYHPRKAQPRGQAVFTVRLFFGLLGGRTEGGTLGRYVGPQSPRNDKAYSRTTSLSSCPISGRFHFRILNKISEWFFFLFNRM